MFDIGMQELIIIFVVALLVFGPNKLPEIGRTVGKWMGEIRRGMNTVKSQMEEEFREEFKMPEDIVKDLPKDPPHEEKTDVKDGQEGKS